MKKVAFKDNKGTGNEVFYYTQECIDFKCFVSKVEELINKEKDGKYENGWIFRGQRESSEDLETLFVRSCDRYDIKPRDRFLVESNMIREFRRRFHHYSTNIPSEDATDEWLALMQHYGAPTRFLDFTYSPYVAAYIAFEKAEPPEQPCNNTCEECKEREEGNKYVAIWAVNYKKLIEKFDVKYPFLSSCFNSYQRDRDSASFNRLFMTYSNNRLVLTANPFRLNERLTYQKGTFLCPSNISSSFVENLSVYVEKDNTLADDLLIKYRIPIGNNNKNTIEALRYLDLMNITWATLSPDLEGFTKSFAPRIKYLFEKPYID